MEGISETIMMVAVLAAVVLSVGVLLELNFKFTDVVQERLQQEANGLMGEIEIINDEHTPVGSNLHIYVKNIGSKPLEGKIMVFLDDKPVEIERISGVGVERYSWFVHGWQTGVTIDIRVDPSNKRGEYHSCVVEILGTSEISDEALINYV